MVSVVITTCPWPKRTTAASSPRPSSRPVRGLLCGSITSPMAASTASSPAWLTVGLTWGCSWDMMAMVPGSGASAPSVGGEPRWPQADRGDILRIDVSALKHFDHVLLPGLAQGQAVPCQGFTQLLIALDISAQ